jgi:predicted DsbA family dithiol-disulfide isomerase
MRSPFMLNSSWLEPGIKQYVNPNLVAEAAKDFGVTDDRVRLAIAHAGMREGKKVGRWEVAVGIASQAAGLDPSKLLNHAQSPAIAERANATTAEFYALQVNQRPAFLLENGIGDRVVLSGLVRIEPLAAAVDALLADESAYTSWKAHFGEPPPA